jgi:hypothetical protein
MVVQVSFAPYCFLLFGLVCAMIVLLCFSLLLHIYIYIYSTMEKNRVRKRKQEQNNTQLFGCFQSSVVSHQSSVISLHRHLHPLQLKRTLTSEYLGTNTVVHLLACRSMPFLRALAC